jgi:hypothetical protein
MVKVYKNVISGVFSLLLFSSFFYSFGTIINNSVYAQGIPGIIDITPSSNIGISSGFVGGQNILQGQSSALPNSFGGQNILQGQSSGLSTCSTTQVPLILTKKVFDPSNLAGGFVNTLGFPVKVTSGVTQVFGQDMRNNDIKEACLLPNQSFDVIESSSVSGFTFSQTSNGNCSGTPFVGNRLTCEITNTITGRTTTSPSGTEIVGESAPAPETRQTNDKNLISAQSGVAGPATSEASSVGRTINPPFGECAVKTLTGQVITALGNATAQKIVSIPSAATYVIKGSVDIDELRKAQDLLKTKVVNIQLVSDLAPADGIQTATGVPQFDGFISVENSDADFRLIKFPLDTIRTECKYITLGNAVAKKPNNILLLGEIGNDKTKPRESIDDKALVSGGTTLGSNLNRDILPATLNPPFRECTQSNAANQPGNEFAIYNIRGEIQSPVDVLKGRVDLILQVTVDLVPQATDLAKINGPNNPYLKANLITQKGDNTHGFIKFRLNDLYTDCKDISLQTDPQFKPLVGEMNP